MIPLDSNRTALLVMDLQADILPRLGDKGAPLLARASGVIAAARKAHVPIVYVVVGFRPGYPEISERNASFAAVSKTGRFVVTTRARTSPPRSPPRRTTSSWSSTAWEPSMEPIWT